MGINRETSSQQTKRALNKKQIQIIDHQIRKVTIEKAGWESNRGINIQKIERPAI